MIVFYCFLIFLSFAPWGDTKSVQVSSVMEDGPLSTANKLKILKNRNILNDIYAQIQGETFSPKKITADMLDVPYKPMKNPYLYNGDIVLTDEQWDVIIENARADLQARNTNDANVSHDDIKKRTMDPNLSSRWPSFPIPYFLYPEVNETVILAALNIWEQETCARFHRQYNLPYNSGLRFTYNNGCYSYVGMVPSYYQPQEISIGYGCDIIAVVCHEIGHALGYFHEQNRKDRDSYITVVHRNINSEYWLEYGIEQTEDYGVGYDYGSVMHYNQFVDSNNGKPAMITHDPNYQATIGQQVGLSFADIKKINLAYCTSRCSNTLNCKNGGYVNPNDCDSCKCPLGLKGRLCGVVATSVGNCGNGDLTAKNTTQKISASGAATCYYLIKAPKARVFFRVTSATFRNIYDTDWPCSSAFLSINYNAEFSKNGAHLCNTTDIAVTHSAKDQLLIIYNGSVGSKFSMNYRADYSLSSNSIQ